MILFGIIHAWQAILNILKSKINKIIQAKSTVSMELANKLRQGILLRFRLKIKSDNKSRLNARMFTKSGR